MAKMYHYQECGLSNVWLENGYKVRKTAYGEALAIEDVEGLYDSIACGLVEKSGPLTAREIRFLRKHLGVSQRVVADALGADVQTVSRWERGKITIPPASDRLLRAYYREIKDGNARLKELIDRLNELDNQEVDRKLRLKREVDGPWKLAA